MSRMVSELTFANLLFREGLGLTMLTAIIKMRYAKRIHAILNEHQISIRHHLPGRIRLASPLWKNKTYTLSYLIKELNKEEKIQSVSHSKETGSLLITYDTAPVNDTKQVERWFQIVEQVLNQLVR
jgi:hypothetical protein